MTNPFFGFFVKNKKGAPPTDLPSEERLVKVFPFVRRLVVVVQATIFTWRFIF